MAEQILKLNVPGIGFVEGREIPVKESTERWSELQLEDGTLLRIKAQVLKVIRADGRYDPEGNPMYAIQGTTIMVVGSAPDHLKKKPTEEGKIH